MLLRLRVDDTRCVLQGQFEKILIGSDIASAFVGLSK